jgi:hypothetical protein
VLKKSGTHMMRNETKHDVRPYRRAVSYKFPRGATRTCSFFDAEVEVALI